MLRGPIISAPHSIARSRAVGLEISVLRVLSVLAAPVFRKHQRRNLPVVAGLVNTTTPWKWGKMATTSNPTKSAVDYRITTNVDASSIPANQRKQCVLFYAPQCEPLARKVAEQAGGSIELGTMRWK